jgi:hypothetical protein
MESAKPLFPMVIWHAYFPGSTPGKIITCWSSHQRRQAKGTVQIITAAPAKYHLHNHVTAATTRHKDTKECKRNAKRMQKEKIMNLPGVEPGIS